MIASHTLTYQHYVALSGGIDSTALALLLPEAIPVFTDTGWESAHRYAHLDKFEAVTGRQVIRLKKEETLPEYIARTKFFPGFNARFCTRMWKIEVFNEYLIDKLPCSLLIGLRADEPEDERTGNETLINGLTIQYPLREQGYRRIDCIRLCIEWGLLPRTVAWEARGGCLGCYFKRKQEIAAMHYLAPDELDKLQALEEETQDERGEFYYMFPNLGMSIREFRARLDAQPMMFPIDEVYQVAADRTGMGTCGKFCNR